MIPSSIRLAGFTITTVYDKSLAAEQGKIGYADYNTNQIFLDSSDICSKEVVEQTYWHEAVHFMLHIMNSNKRTDEAFVDLLSHMIYQATQTATYPQEDPSCIWCNNEVLLEKETNTIRL